MKNLYFKNIFITLAIFFTLVPLISFAQTPKLDYSGLVQCDGVLDKNEPNRQKVCDFAALLSTVKYLINWLFVITIPIATVSFAYAGFLYLTGTSGNIGTAKKIFQSVAVGFIIMLIAWVSVVTAVNWFIDKNSAAGSSSDTFVNLFK